MSTNVNDYLPGKQQAFLDRNSEKRQNNSTVRGIELHYSSAFLQQVLTDYIQNFNLAKPNIFSCGQIPIDNEINKDLICCIEFAISNLKKSTKYFQFATIKTSEYHNSAYSFQ